MGDEHGQHVLELAKHLTGANGMLTGSGPAGALPVHAQAGPTENRFGRGESSQFPEVDPVWHYGFLFSPALTIGGGTFAIQRNIVAEQVLGLPRDIDPDRRPHVVPDEAPRPLSDLASGHGGDRTPADAPRQLRCERSAARLD